MSHIIVTCEKAFIVSKLEPYPPFLLDFHNRGRRGDTSIPFTPSIPLPSNVYARVSTSCSSVHSTLVTLAIDWLTGSVAINSQCITETWGRVWMCREWREAVGYAGNIQQARLTGTKETKRRNINDIELFDKSLSVANNSGATVSRRA